MAPTLETLEMGNASDILSLLSKLSIELYFVNYIRFIMILGKGTPTTALAILFTNLALEIASSILGGVGSPTYKMHVEMGNRILYCYNIT